MEITHRPKGRMCINCVRMSNDTPCPELKEFKSMPVIGKDKSDNMKVVKCHSFQRSDKADLG